MKKFLLLIALAFCLVKNAQAQNNQIDSLTFSTENGLLILEGSLNGVKTNFAFDTGASMGVLSSKNIKEANIEITGSRTINDSQKKSARIGKAKIDTLKIGTQLFFNVISVVTDMPFLYCNSLYLLGGDVINQLNWKFDFEKNQVYFSKKPFLPQKEMTQMPIKIIANRHFSNLTLAGTSIDNVLIDFGYAGNCTMDSKLKSTKEIVKKQLTDSIYKSKSFSSGLNSNSVGKETLSFYIDAVTFGGLTFNTFKINAMEQTHNKIGISFLKKNFKQIILNNTEVMYWLMPNAVEPQKTKNFDAGFYYNDNRKIQVVALNSAKDNSANALRIGEEIKNINGRSAASFIDRCAFTTWYAQQIKQDNLWIEKLNGERITIKKSIF